MAEFAEPLTNALPLLRPAKRQRGADSRNARKADPPNARDASSPRLQRRRLRDSDAELPLQQMLEEQMLEELAGRAPLHSHHQ